MPVGIFAQFDREVELDHICIADLQNVNLTAGIQEREQV